LSIITFIRLIEYVVTAIVGLFALALALLVGLVVGLVGLVVDGIRWLGARRG
jgi:hypothetical protein